MESFVLTATILIKTLEILYSQDEILSDFESLILLHHFESKLEHIKWKQQHLMVAYENFVSAARRDNF